MALINTLILVALIAGGYYYYTQYQNSVKIYNQNYGHAKNIKVSNWKLTPDGTPVMIEGVKQTRGVSGHVSIKLVPDAWLNIDSPHSGLSTTHEYWWIPNNTLINGEKGCKSIEVKSTQPSMNSPVIQPHAEGTCLGVTGLKSTDSKEYNIKNRGKGLDACFCGDNSNCTATQAASDGWFKNSSQSPCSATCQSRESGRYNMNTCCAGLMGDKHYCPNM